MNRASQPTCFRSNHPNIKVGRNTTTGLPDATTKASCAFLLSVYQSTATEFTTDDGSVGHHGLVTDLLPAMIERCGTEVIYACGPRPMLAAVTALPVIGVPVPLEHLDGMDSLLSIVQMPSGVPVATVGVGNARNAGLLAVRILAAADADLRQRMLDFQADLRTASQEKGTKVRASTGGHKLGF